MPPSRKGPISALEDTRRAMRTSEADAQSLADRMPELLVEAQRISTTVAHGIHGRRRPRRSGSSGHMRIRMRPT